MSYFEAVERTEVSIDSPKGYCKLALRESDAGFYVGGSSETRTGEALGGVAKLIVEHAAPILFTTKAEAVEFIKARAQKYLEDAFAA